MGETAGGMIQSFSDGAYRNDIAGAGVVIQDHSGEIMATMAVRLHGIVDASFAEVMEFGGV